MIGSLLLVCLSCAISTTIPIAHVQGLGSLRGKVSEISNSVALFNHIPYALPPVGFRRWRSPTPYGPWQSPRDASMFGNRCFGLATDPKVDASEDCLFLNVAAPLGTVGSEQRLPVMAYIHGGAYDSGASNHNHPDALVARSLYFERGSIVVVTMNYRLNAFGFLGSSVIKNRTADGSTGNFGIQDQRLALAWVRDHIHAFGGDAGKVTIFGESAGGNSVLQHLTQTASFGLYKHAIIESGDYLGSYSLGIADSNFMSLLNITACEDLDCLLVTPAVKLAAAARNVTNWGPVVDGVSLHDFPQVLLRRGAFNKVPVILGSNRDEIALWTADESSAAGLPPDLSEADLDALIDKKFSFLGPDGIAKLKELYWPSKYTYPEFRGNYSQAWWTATSMSTDGGAYGDRHTALGHCSVRRASRSLVRRGNPDVYVYLFAHPSRETVVDMNEGKPLAGTAAESPLVPHASELPYVFGFTHALHAGKEADLALAMSEAWLHFAHSGNPNGGDLPTWLRYHSLSDGILRFDSHPGSSYLYRNRVCNFWDAHQPQDHDGSEFIV